MSKVAGPDLRKLMDKRVAAKLNGNRRVNGVLRGFDQFMARSFILFVIVNVF